MKVLIKIFEILVNKRLAKEKGRGHKVKFVKFWQGKHTILVIAKLLKSSEFDGLVDSSMLILILQEHGKTTFNDYGNWSSEWPASDAYVHVKQLVTQKGLKEVRL